MKWKTIQKSHAKILDLRILKDAEVKERIQEVVFNEKQPRREEIERSEIEYKNWKKIKDQVIRV